MDVNKLKGKIVERGMSVEVLAERLHMDRATLYRKIKRRGDTLTVKEMNLIKKELGLSIEEATSIFFGNDVA